MATKILHETDVKKLISSVLCSSPTGVSIRQLQKDFLSLVGYEVPFRSFGHLTLESYLRTIPDICEVKGFGVNAMLIHVVSKNLEHLNKLIINQKVNKTSRSHATFRRPTGIKKEHNLTTSGSKDFINDRYSRQEGNPSVSVTAVQPDLRNICDENIKHTFNLTNHTEHRKGENSNEPSLGGSKSFTSFVKRGGYRIPIGIKREKFNLTTQRSANCTINQFENNYSSEVSTAGESDEENFKPTFADVNNLELDSYLNNHNILQNSFKHGVYQKVTGVRREEPNVALQSNDEYKRHENICSSSASTASQTDEPNISEENINRKYNTSNRKELARYVGMDPKKIISNRRTALIKQRLRFIMKEYPIGLSTKQLTAIYKRKFNSELLPSLLECSTINELCGLFNNEIFYIIKLHHSDLLLFDINEPKPNPDDYHRCNPFDINEYPPEVMILGEDFDVQTLHTGYESSEQIPILVVNITDPSNFYLQYEFNKKFQQRRELVLDQIQLFYSKFSSSYIIQKAHILSDMPCVVLVDDIFYRATITKKISDQIQVFLVDYGDIQIVERTNLFYLRDEFTILPKQAVYGGLSSVKPITGNEWSLESIRRFQQMVEGKKCEALISSTEETLGKTNFTITDSDIDIVINDTLIEEGYASRC